ncbi:hypothetical protein PspLS_09830 [Pyricularia sp. CBS 133598]|nr:hypothetical protein PspLS_09830 [Pyricularia sp. CBS 133598]
MRLGTFYFAAAMASVQAAPGGLLHNGFEREGYIMVQEANTAYKYSLLKVKTAGDCKTKGKGTNLPGAETVLRSKHGHEYDEYIPAWKWKSEPGHC